MIDSLSCCSKLCFFFGTQKENFEEYFWVSITSNVTVATENITVRGPKHQEVRFKIQILLLRYICMLCIDHFFQVSSVLLL